MGNTTQASKYHDNDEKFAVFVACCELSSNMAANPRIPCKTVNDRCTVLKYK